MMKKLLIFFAVFAASICMFAMAAQAGTLDSVDIYLKYDSIAKAMNSEMRAPTSIIDAGEEKINTATGGVAYYSEEVKIPGAGGLDFTVGRRFNSDADTDVYGVSYYASVKDYRDVVNPAQGEKYVFEYYLNEDLSGESVYVAFDSINDVFEIEAGTNTITVLANYKNEAINLNKTNSKYHWEIEYRNKDKQARADIGLDDDLYLYDSIAGGDLPLYRDTSKECTVVWASEKNLGVYTKSCNIYSDIALGGGWEYDIPYLMSTDVTSDDKYDYEYGMFYDAFAKETVSYCFKYTSEKLISARCYYISKPISNSENPGTGTKGMYTIEAEFDYDGAYVASFVITRIDGMKFEFEESCLTAIEDRFGNRITYDYDQPGFRIVVTDTLGRKIGLSTDGITLNGVKVIEYYCDIINDDVEDPNDYYYEDDRAEFTARYRIDANKVKDIVYYHSQTGRVYSIGKPHTITYSKVHIDKIILPTGAERNYEYETVTQRNYFGGSNRDKSCTARYDLQKDSSVMENEVRFEYIDFSGYTPTTRTYYPGRSGYEVKETYDKEGCVTKRVTTCEDVGYEQTEDYTYVLTDGVWREKTKTVSRAGAGASSGYTERYQYDYKTHNLTNITRDERTIYTAQYSTYGLLWREYKLQGSGYIGIKNVISEKEKGIIEKQYATKTSFSANAVVKEKVKYTYDGYGNIASIDGDGGYVEYTYEYGDYSGSTVPDYSIIITKTYPGVENITDRNGNDIPSANIEEKEYYSRRGRLVKTTDGEGNSTEYAYDYLGRILKITNPDNTRKVYSYNDTRNRLYEADENGKRKMTAYDSLGRETGACYMNEEGTSWQWIYYKSYDKYGNMMGYSPYRDGLADCTTKYTYYSDNSVKTERLRNRLSGSIIMQNIYSYYVAGENLNAVSTARKKNETETVTVTNYTDQYGNKVKDTIDDGTTVREQIYTTDICGTIKQVDDFNGNAAHKYTYDYRGRILKDKYPIGYSENVYKGALLYQTKDALGNVTKTYEYNTRGQVIRETTPVDDNKDNVTEYYYDRSGNLTKTVTSTGDGTTTKTVSTQYDNRSRPTAVNDGSGYFTRYEYDNIGNVTRMATGVPTTDEALDRDIHSVTDYEYSYRDFLIGVTDPLGHKESYTHNSRGTVLTYTDKNGTLFEYTYNGAPWLLTKTATGTDGTEQTISYTYDNLGNVSQMTDDTGTTVYKYDCLGNTAEETRGTTVKTYGYDLNGNRTSADIVSGSFNQSLSYVYDKNNRLTKVTDDSGYTSYIYNDNNRVVTEKTLSNGTTEAYTSYTYYDSGLLKTKKSKGGPNVTGSYTIGYYADGNISEVNDGETVRGYSYDSAGRLASESIGGEVTASYTYDAYGNRAQKTEPDRVTKYTYNLSNQLILEDVNGNTTGFGYDGNGNLRSQISGAGETYYIYDLMGRMIQSNVNDTVTDYTYDGDGMRLTKTNGEKTINYINDGMYVSGEVSGESVVKYTYGRSLISIDNNGTMGYYHTDEHGNVRKVTDSKGNTLASYEYDAFGQETGTAVDYYNPMRYCGEYRDEETGLIYLRARYYDSGIGRFISEDPAKDGENWYAYCAGNPVMFVDPSGLTVILEGTQEDRSIILAELNNLTNYTLSYNIETGELAINTTLLKGGDLYEAGNGLLLTLKECPYDVIIEIGSNGNKARPDNKAKASDRTGCGGKVEFDPNSNPKIDTWNADTGEIEPANRPNYIGLGHELVHTLGFVSGTTDYDLIQSYHDINGDLVVVDDMKAEEPTAVGLMGTRAFTENDLRAEHHLSLRGRY